MVIWDAILDLIRASIFAWAQIFGGNLASGIVMVTCLVRLALLPLTLRLSRAAAAHQRQLASLKPQLEKLRERFAKRPEKLTAEMKKLFEREGVSVVPTSGCLSALVQMPVALGLFQAIRGLGAAGRFLWIGNLARPDAILAVIVTALTFTAIRIGQPPTVDQTQSLLLAVSSIVTLVVMARLSAAVSLYVAVSAGFSVAQASIVRRCAAQTR